MLHVSYSCLLNMTQGRIICTKVHMLEVKEAWIQEKRIICVKLKDVFLL